MADQTRLRLRLNGQYKVNLKVPAKDAKDLMDEIKGIAKNEFGDKASSARMPWKTDAETGEIVIITKSKFKPKIVDSAGHMIRDDRPRPSTAAQPSSWLVRLPLQAGRECRCFPQLAGVQIIDLVSEAQGGGSVNFAPVDGGFVAANDNPANDNDDAEEASEGSYNF